MLIANNNESLQEILAQHEARRPRALVPTMGNLHRGHLALVQAAKAEGSFVVATVFVNPLQFGPNEDFTEYPRTLKSDIEALQALNVDLLYAPSVSDIYPNGEQNHTRVTVPESLTNTLCGASRPGHFAGVTSVVYKLIRRTAPDLAFFGEKDWQQLVVIKRMVADLELGVVIRGVDIQRDPDGLALSSRNQYLSDEDRKIAPVLNQTLEGVRQKVAAGAPDIALICDEAEEHLTSTGFQPDYVAVRDEVTLESRELASHGLRVFGAAYLGTTRLIDNVAVSS